MENGKTNDLALEEKDANRDALHPQAGLDASSKDNNVANTDTDQRVSATVDNYEPPWSIWSPRQKRFIVLAASCASLLSPLSSQIYFPALNAIATDLSVSNGLVNLSITLYLVRLFFHFSHASNVSNICSDWSYSTKSKV